MYNIVYNCLLVISWWSVVLAANNKLPDTLQIGFATASYQVEGAWNESGKGENIWDRYTHSNPDLIADRTNGDIADDTYHKYKEDVQLLKQTGAKVYRFSLSWTRILPNGEYNKVNKPGLDYYNNLINELIANGIVPLVTLYHWDLPQQLQEIGGWPNPLMANYFEDYARVAFEQFGDRVKHWITFNEPLQTSNGGYGETERAPALGHHGTADYLATHTIILAHARVYHLYDKQFRPTQKGLIGITLDSDWFEPKTNSSADVQAAQDAMQFDIGWYAHPIFHPDGDYPPVMRRNVDANSAAEGRPRSRLPVFTPEEIQYVKGTSDFYGTNHYTTRLYEAGNGTLGADPSFYRDKNALDSVDPSWSSGASSWLKVVPWGIRKHLNFIKNEYNNPMIFITENGYSDHGELEDDARIRYHNEYLQAILDAIYEDGCNVTIYTAWSFLDNFEWASGYTERFGFYHVDITDPGRKRTAKKSVSYFQQLASTRTLPELKNGKFST